MTKFIVEHNGKTYTFNSGTECMVFDYAQYNSELVPEKDYLTFVNEVHELYLKDENPCPVGALADWVARNWETVKHSKKSRREILVDFYYSI